MLRLDDQSEPELILQTLSDERSGMLSPDARWLAYVSNESGPNEVYLRPFPRRPGEGLHRRGRRAHVGA